MSLDTAQQTLEEQGAMLPTGFGLKDDVDFDFVPGEPLPDLADIVDDLWAFFDSAKDSYRAVAVVSEVLYNGGQAILAQFEHREGGAFTTLLPFSQSLQEGGIKYGDPEDTSVHSRVWV